jgi:transcription initiation factor TFIIIB Brf1 subunit/transcription initiation factor TFIIB
MQTGRKPSGLCGAALYIAALSHGLDYSKSEIVNTMVLLENIVHSSEIPILILHFFV